MRTQLSNDIKNGVRPLKAIMNEADRSGDDFSHIASDLQKGTNYLFSRLYLQRLESYVFLSTSALEQYGKTAWERTLGTKGTVKEINQILYQKGVKLWEGFVPQPYTNYCKQFAESQVTEKINENIFSKKTKEWNGVKLIEILLNKISWSLFGDFLNINHQKLYYVKAKVLFLGGEREERWLSGKENIYGPFFDMNDLLSHCPELDESKAF